MPLDFGPPDTSETYRESFEGPVAFTKSTSIYRDNPVVSRIEHDEEMEGMSMMNANMVSDILSGEPDFEAAVSVLSMGKEELEPILEELEGQEEIDLLLEGFLEGLEEACTGDHDIPERLLFEIYEVLEEQWLTEPHQYGDWDGYELLVRVAELMGTLGTSVRPTDGEIAEQLHSADWKRRMLGARTVRALGLEDEKERLAHLEQDDFEDDNGFFLVREAAGFEEEEDDE